VPDRLEELRRQRALQREHLASIDREIAALEGTGEAPVEDTPPFVGAFSSGTRTAEEILGKYREAGLNDPSKAKRGCLLLFLAAIALLFAGLGAMYFYIKAKRGG
jgi:hypothetical protein